MSATLVGLLVCIALVVFLVLVVMGALREVVILRGEVAALERVVTDDPLPSILHEQLPARVARELPRGLAGRPGVHVLIAVSDGCDSCDYLVTSLGGSGRSYADRVTVLVRTSSSDGSIAQAARAISENVVLDDRGRLFSALKVHATPMMFAVDTATTRVISLKGGADSAWIDQNLNPQLASERDGAAA